MSNAATPRSAAKNAGADKRLSANPSLLESCPQHAIAATIRTSTDRQPARTDSQHERTASTDPQPAQADSQHKPTAGKDPVGIETVDRDSGRPVETRRAPAGTIVTVAILAVLAVAAVALQSVIASRNNRAPYAAAAIHASVRMEMVAPGRAQAAVDRLAGSGRLNAPIVEPVEGQVAQQQVVGQLTFRTPHNAQRGGQYALFIIDP